jgi:hypothetical protein
LTCFDGGQNTPSAIPRLASVGPKIGRVDRLKVRQCLVWRATARTSSIKAAVALSGSPHSMYTSTKGDRAARAAGEPPP